MYNEDSICVQVMFCNSNFLLNYRKKQRVKNVTANLIVIKLNQIKLN